MGHLSKKEAQARVDRIISFRAELDEMARDGVARLKGCTGLSEAFVWIISISPLNIGNFWIA